MSWIEENAERMYPDSDITYGAGAVREAYAYGANEALKRLAQPEVNSVDPLERYLCVCGKRITLTKAGVFRHHRGNEKDYPGSPWKKVCVGVGVKP